MSIKIKNISAREILSSGSYPTIEIICTLTSGAQGRASPPFGVSSGRHEARILLDRNSKRYQGFGMTHAVKLVNSVLKKIIVNKNPFSQKALDNLLIQKDGTKNKSRFGANTILGVSLSIARASSNQLRLPLYVYLRRAYEISFHKYLLPSPMMVMIEGGRHADNSSDIQEYLISVIKKTTTKEKIRCGIEVYLTLKKILQKSGHNTNVGNEGGFALEGIRSNELPLKYILSAIAKSGCRAGRDIMMSLDIAASELLKNGKYVLLTEKKSFSPEKLSLLYGRWIKKYPIYSIEDPFDEDDWQSWRNFFSNFGKKIKIVGDDLTVTNAARLKRALKENIIHSIIIKPNQIGTLTETMDVCLLAIQRKIEIIASHRGGGETSDTSIVDIAAAVNAAFIKVGPSRGERVEKYNRLMEIASEVE